MVTSERKDKPEPSAEQRAAEELVRRAREQGLSLTGPEGLLKQLTKTVLETALNQELTEHLGHDKHGPAGNEAGNVRNGARPKTVLTEATGQVGIEVPRDRAGTFEPQIVRKRQRRLSGVDEMVLSLYAKGLTTGEISAHFAEIYGASVSKETISRITGKVTGEMTDWCNRPLDVCGGLHGCGDGQGQRRPGRQPAHLRRDRCHRGRGERHLGAVGRHRR
jgi:putative transposase